MKKFEYTTVVEDHPVPRESLIRLNRMGEEGWELCAVVWTTQIYRVSIVYYFKREKETHD